MSPSLGAPAALAAFGDRPALVTATEVLTYRELAQRVADTAARLGPQRSLVLLPVRNDVPSVVAYLAALAGRHPVLLAPAGEPARLAELAQRWDPDVVVEGGAPGRRRPGSAHALHPDLALLLSTSGSTGAPRLVRLSGAAVDANARAIATSLAITAADRAATTLPMHYCYGLSVVNSHLATGAALVLTDASVVDPGFWRLFREAGATSFAAVPHTVDLLDRVGFAQMQLPSLRCVTQAGGRLAPDRVGRYARLGRERGFDFVVMYGQTEATARMAYLPPHLAESHPDSIGVPLPGGHLSLRPAPEASGAGVGELVYRGPNVMLGYADRPADLALGRCVEALTTGDLARQGPDGLWEVVGRRARFAKLFGLRVDLQQVEGALSSAGTDAVCADGGDRLVVAVAAGAPAVPVVRDLAARAAGLPGHAVSVSVWQELPRLASGKPDTAAVVARERALRAAPTVSAGGATAGTAAVRALLAEVLEVPAVTDDDSFAGLGGDSLSYVEAAVRLEEALGPLPTDWPARTVRQLAAPPPAVRRSPPREHDAPGDEAPRGDRARASGAAAAAHPTAASRRRVGGWVPEVAGLETSVAVRAVAIVLVVATHSGLLAVQGGAHALLAVAGLNAARFTLVPGSRTQRLRRLGSAAALVAVPAALWWLLVHALTDAYRLADVVPLAGVLRPAEPEAQWHLWFVEALLGGLVLVAAVVALPALDRLERRHPFAVPVVLVLLALAPRAGLLPVPSGRPWLAAPVVLWVFALGWAAARAHDVPRRLLVSALALASAPGFFGDPVREGVLLAALALLVWAPTLPWPRPLVRPAATVAAASLATYLTHWLVYPPLEPHSPLAATAASLAVGVLTWRGTALLARSWADRRTRCPARRARPTPGGTVSLHLLRAVPLTAAVAVLAVLTGCGADSTGDEGGALVVYSGRQEALVQPLFDQFTEQSGIELEVRYGASADLAAQLVEEGERSPADVFVSQDAGALGAVSGEGLLTELPADVLERVDPRYRADDGTWVGVSGRARVLAYDARAVPAEQVPTSVFQLTDPRWRGQVAVAPTNASFQAFVTAMRVLEGEERTRQWLEDLAANDPQLYEGNVDILRAVDEGTVPLGLINHYYWYELAEEEGGEVVNAEIGWLDQGDPGALVNVAGAGVLTPADPAADAQELVGFLLSEPAQRYFAEQTAEYPLIAGVPAKADLPPLGEVSGPQIDLSDLSSLGETLALLEEVELL